MGRSRSKRNYHYEQGPGSDALPISRMKSRNFHQNINGNHFDQHTTGINHRRFGGMGNNRNSKIQDNSFAVTTDYKILCNEDMIYSIVGKGGSVIKSIQQYTGAWINIHELIPGDDERVIEVTDTRKRGRDGRISSFSPAQDALILIHERILENYADFVGDRYDDVDGGGGSRVSTRLVVQRMHVGCLLGKGGKIIEQMRAETNSQIRVLPRDNNIPQCVLSSEEIVQIFGYVDAVKNAVEIITSRLKESLERDRGPFHVWGVNSQSQFSTDDFSPMECALQRSFEGGSCGTRFPSNLSIARTSSYSSLSSGLAIEHAAASDANNSQFFSSEELLFRILCPVNRVDYIIGESSGILDLLQNEVGVNIHVADLISGADEQIITVSSDEGPDNELFPAQEALLHIQSAIADPIPDKDNFIITRLVVPSSEIGCLNGRDGSLSMIMRLSGAKVEILKGEDVLPFIPANSELIQIYGEIKDARDALVEVTSRIRRHVFKESHQKDTIPPSIYAPTNGVNADIVDKTSLNVLNRSSIGYCGSDHPSTDKNSHSKELGGHGNGLPNQNGCDISSDLPNKMNNRASIPMVTRSILEVVIPKQATLKLLTKSNRLSQFSELSGASVTLLEDNPDDVEKVIRISGSPEQAAKAESLLQGFILSTQEDMI